MTRLLPPNATPTEAALETATARLGDVPVVAGLWDPETCPAAVLPWLAWALSIDEWDAGWTDETKRRIVASSVAVHRRKGTVAAVKRAVADAGYGDAQVIERFGLNLYNGTRTHNAAITHAPQDHWAEYRLVLSRPLTIAQAETVRRLVAAAAPARCKLKAVDFRAALNLYDATITHNGSYSHGVA